MPEQQQPKYYLERYDDYYPSGGTGDLEGPFDTVNQCKDAARKSSFEQYTILKVENNIITPYLALDYNEWKPVDNNPIR